MFVQTKGSKLADDPETNAGIFGASLVYACATGFAILFYIAGQKDPGALTRVPFITPSFGLYFVGFSFFSMPINAWLVGSSVRESFDKSGFVSGFLGTFFYIALSPIILVMSIFYRIFKFTISLMP